MRPEPAETERALYGELHKARQRHVEQQGEGVADEGGSEEHSDNSAEGPRDKQ